MCIVTIEEDHAPTVTQGRFEGKAKAAGLGRIKEGSSAEAELS